MQSQLEGEQQSLHQWNTVEQITRDQGHDHYMYFTYWNDTFLNVFYTDILREAMEALP